MGGWRLAFGVRRSCSSSSSRLRPVVWNSGRLRRAGCPQIRPRGVMEYWSTGVLSELHPPSAGLESWAKFWCLTAHKRRTIF